MTSFNLKSMRSTPEGYRTALTPAEKLRVCVAVLLEGVDQHRVAALMGVNLERVNEAVQIGRKAFGFPIRVPPEV